MDYWDATDYILALPDMERFKSAPQGQTMSLDAMNALLKKLKNPHLGRKTVHVTGSKGKGSTATMIASILHEAGLKTALYTSPHLHDYVERLVFEMLPVSRFDFADGVAEIRDAIEEVNASDLGPVSTFGALTALFFHLCKKKRVEYQIVEVGMGGTFDATNVFLAKEAAVITPISLEHTAILGETCAAIAEQKAGIITSGCYTIVAPQQDESVYKPIKAACKKKHAEFVDVRDYKIRPTTHDSNGQSFAIEYGKRSYKLHTAMLGEHQLVNAATAVATVEALTGLSPQIDLAAIEDGIADTDVPGRLEQLTRHPITVVDGAHNGESMRALCASVQRHFDYDAAVIILGINADKNLDEMMAAIAELQPKLVIATRSENARACEPEVIAKAAARRNLSVRMAQNVPAAIDIAREHAAHDDLVCITGSLYVVGDARREILAIPVTH